MENNSIGNVLNNPIFKRNNEGAILESLVKHGVEVEFIDPITFKSIIKIGRKNDEQQSHNE